MAHRRSGLHLHGSTFAHRSQGASHAITAAAAGDRVLVVLWFDALARWVGGTFDEAVDPGDEAVASRHRALGLPPPSEMLAEARAIGARLAACETAVLLSGGAPAAA